MVSGKIENRPPEFKKVDRPAVSIIVDTRGRTYVTDEAIAGFIRRAEAGECAKEHKAPRRWRYNGSDSPPRWPC
jgi:hypothetical protein